MKKLLLVAFALFCAVAMASAAYADLESSATAHVWLNINPNIAVTNVDGGLFPLGDLQTGVVRGRINFRVDANNQSLLLGGFVSNLYKGDAPNSPVKPIAVVTRDGLPITAEIAHEKLGGTGVASYDSTSTIVETFPGYATEFLEFESGQNNDFSQGVTLIPSWINSDHEQPQGEYSGIVVLYAMIPEDGSV